MHMCGIYAVFLQEKTNQSTNENQDKALKYQAQKLVFEGIKRIEYRGYDSWGVASISPESKTTQKSKIKESIISVEKHVGKISQVEKISLPNSRRAIGHTRWATHGGVTLGNAHPHQASDGSFVLVQNGVVENYQTLKKEQAEAGYVFKTETDTEVIVRLIESKKKEYNANQIDPKIIQDVYHQLDGRSTVVVLEKSGDMYAFRNGSPLVIGTNEQGDVFLSSDVLSLSNDADFYQMIENGQMVTINSQGIEVRNCHDLTEVTLDLQPIDLENVTIDKQDHAHFMEKEILEQAQVLVNVCQMGDADLVTIIKLLKASDQVFVVGAGSASYVADYLAFQLRKRKISASLVRAYEADSFYEIANEKSVCIAISQSGETADTNEVVEKMKNKGATVASIVNMPGSTLTQISDYPFMLQVGPEVAVASTKAMTGQMIWGWVVAQVLDGRLLPEIKEDIQAYQSSLNQWLHDRSSTEKIDEVVSYLETHQQVFILGRGELYPSALEFALKLKEISYLHAEGFSGGELKHGVIALLEPGTPVICLVSDDKQKASMLNAAAEVKARQAKVIGIAPENNQLFDVWIPICRKKNFLPISTIIPAQLVTYHLAVKMGFDPDKPRNLAKSVTVK